MQPFLMVTAKLLLAEALGAAAAAAHCLDGGRGFKQAENIPFSKAGRHMCPP